MSAPAFERFLKWYPRQWRARYGIEFVALMEDTYGAGKVPPRSQLAIVRSGFGEHRREWRQRAGADGERVRMGSLLVFGAWSLVAVAGVGFAKMTEHWEIATPRGFRALPSGAYDAVQWAAGLGIVTLFAAAIGALPAFVRLLGGGGWSRVRGPILRATFMSLTTVLVSIGLVCWDHLIGPLHTRSGTSLSGVGIGWALLVVLNVIACTGAAITVGRSIKISPMVLRCAGLLALILAIAMFTIVAGTLVFVGALLIDAPQFFAARDAGLFATPATVSLAVIGVVMFTGLLTACAGARRIIGSIRMISPQSTDITKRANLS